ncbi:Glycosyltransferase [hydrothermal vent metagenome]|uniref:Glycosyltransferase n=1 Tax=hydrothermal vent metagenome TaxID=652676 RepID=A0A1W1CV50_9ZZZZ
METFCISIIVPCYNEEEVVQLFLEEVSPILKRTKQEYEIIFVNDGSKDNTLEKLLSLKSIYEPIRIIHLSRNFGKEAALTAGLDCAKGDVIIPIDADLQDPPELIEQFIDKWKEGYEVVLAKRIDRKSDSIAKRYSANLFYKFHNTISTTTIPDNVGDYRLMSRKVVTAIQQLPENQRFMKGIFAWVGFKTTTIEYVRETRKAGETSFSAWKLWNFALDGITSFSTVPLRIWFYIGSFISFLSLVYGSAIIIKTLIYGIDLPGYASIFTTVLFLGGIQLMGIGILGEYIGRLYQESKRRPIYIIENEY